MWTVWLWMTGLRPCPPQHGAMFSVMLPVSAALVGVLFLGEALTGVRQLVAFAIALSGVLLATCLARRCACGARTTPTDPDLPNRQVVNACALTTMPSASAYNRSPPTPWISTATSRWPSPRRSVGSGISASARMPTAAFSSTIAHAAIHHQARPAVARRCMPPNSAHQRAQQPAAIHHQHAALARRLHGGFDQGSCLRGILTVVTGPKHRLAAIALENRRQDAERTAHIGLVHIAEIAGGEGRVGSCGHRTKSFKEGR